MNFYSDNPLNSLIKKLICYSKIEMRKEILMYYFTYINESIRVMIFVVIMNDV